MKHFFPLVPSLLSILFGCVLLLHLLAWAGVQGPKLQGNDYWWAVLTILFGPKTGWLTAAGLGAVVLGLAGVAWATLLTGAGRWERQEALPLFWWSVVGGAAGVLALLVAVNYFGMQAGQMVVIAGRFCR